MGMSDVVQQIKDKLDLAAFLGSYIKLSPAGKNLKGLCPFHKEKTPSFMVSPDRQIWHCFGCAAGGDLIGFLMKYENLEFVEALKILGEKAGIDIGRAGNQDQRQINVLYHINAAAKEFFKKSLTQEALNYLYSRGLKKETIEEFELGYAPAGSDALLRYLLSAKFAPADIEKAGLTFKTERGTFIDRFRNRIMFPLHNSFGKSIGFTGRIMPLPSEALPVRQAGLAKEGGYEAPKYVNSPETPIFNKSKLLYGFDKTKGLIRESRTAVLIEGQMDFLMAWQDGLKNLAATSGTAMTGEHLKILKRVADTLVLSFDRDDAGQAATERTIDLAGAADFAVKVLMVPEGVQAKDPADIVNASSGLFASLAAKAVPAMDYYFAKYDVSKKISVTQWKQNIRAVLGKIKMLYSPVEKARYIQELAGLSGVAEHHLQEEMEGLPSVKTAGDSGPSESSGEKTDNDAPISRKEVISQRIASLVASHKNLYGECAPALAILDPNYQKAIAYHCDSQSVSLPEEIRSLVDLIALRTGLELISDPIKAKTELGVLTRQLKMENLKGKRQEMVDAIRLAEKTNDDAKLAVTLSEFDKLSKEIQTLEQ
ncbi:MAG: DNA primase [Candidatus Harrisonbacteria bacterium RIFOXYA1_FULL_48_8]|uniref:DNA primase n=3 Tax=Parcubacteria group TaxID=1794811 RepID=A0A0G1W4E8_9BACT|nr:MAG: primase protein [Candidatus Giovannonibacteria bacterium GW2011_GWB1_47_6b]KKU94960.1 MAG: primase protein [Parcubacteria group bacterium GW2011_GWA1_48_11b]OGY69201.1 MAG: DNA primase [Candidatus Harrisonbacteria bacterium RIFOXYA1_FULL_48_8]